jgi:hypothetical protein
MKTNRNNGFDCKNVTFKSSDSQLLQKSNENTSKASVVRNKKAGRNWDPGLGGDSELFDDVGSAADDEESASEIDDLRRILLRTFLFSHHWNFC